MSGVRLNSEKQDNVFPSMIAQWKDVSGVEVHLCEQAIDDRGLFPL
jgi:sulfur relay (sulfurtransferase) complex TusBCD TusD component (DsrE family)